MRLRYLQGILLMIAAVLPTTLLLLSIIIWTDPEERSPFRLVLMNNGIGLFVIGLVPAAAVSVIHTKLANRGNASAVKWLRLRSTLYGAGLGLTLALGISAITVGAVSTRFWMLYGWGIVAGAAYGILAVVIGSRGTGGRGRGPRHDVDSGRIPVE